MNGKLIKAVMRGDVAQIEILAAGVQLNQALEDGMTLVLIAAAFGQLEAVRVLAELGADVRVPDNQGYTPVHVAAFKGHVEAIRLLTELGADLSVANNGATPVVITAQGGHVEAIRVLAELGADVSAATNDGATPVFIAAQNGHVEAIRVLAELGADVRVLDNQGYTPVHQAAFKGHVEAIRLLTELGADVRVADNVGITPVYIAAEYGHVEVIRVLAELGADVRVPDNQGYTPVHVAAQNGHLEAIRVLAEFGADVSAVSNNGATPIVMAAQGRHVEAIRVLAELGADVSVADSDDRTPFDYVRTMFYFSNMFYISAKHDAVIRALADGGCPQSCAYIFRALWPQVTWRIHKQTNPLPIFEAAQRGEVKQIAEPAPDVIRRDSNGNSVFDVAGALSPYRREQVIRALAKVGCAESRAYLFKVRWPYIRLKRLAERNRATINPDGPAVQVASILADIDAFTAHGLDLSSSTGERIFRLIMSYVGQSDAAPEKESGCNIV